MSQPKSAIVCSICICPHSETSAVFALSCNACILVTPLLNALRSVSHQAYQQATYLHRHVQPQTSSLCISGPTLVHSTLHAGASLTASYSGTIEQESVSTDSQTYQVTVKGGLTGSAADDLTYTIMLAYFGNNLHSAVASGTAYPLIGGLPADGCSAFRFPNSMPGKVVLLQRGNCTFQTKVYSAPVYVHLHEACAQKAFGFCLCCLVRVSSIIPPVFTHHPTDPFASY